MIIINKYINNYKRKYLLLKRKLNQIFHKTVQTIVAQMIILLKNKINNHVIKKVIMINHKTMKKMKYKKI